MDKDDLSDILERLNREVKLGNVNEALSHLRELLDGNTVDEALADTGQTPSTPSARRIVPPELAEIVERVRTPAPPMAREVTNPEGPRLGRFYNLGLVGRGGMGEVFRVRDPELGRRMVIKILRSDRVDDEDAVARFVEEAQITSQLAHPGVVPVFEIGVIDEKRLYFTMREVRGRTLSKVIKDAHAQFHALAEGQRSWDESFRGLVDIFIRLCEPIAYAHSRSIIHRDLKPSNVMVGDFGEVQVLDWGLAKKVGTRESPGLGLEDSEVLTHRAPGSVFETHEGSIVGTPAFMPPEQARGCHESLGPAADVYSLGAILFTLLDGEPPFDGTTASAVLLKLLDGVQRRPGEALGAPKALVEICLRAMAPDPNQRFLDASQLARAVSDWRDGASRRETALKHVAKADALTAYLEELRQRAAELRETSRKMLESIEAASPVREKRAAWSLEDEAEFLEREASARQGRQIQHLEAAISFVSDLREARDRLATIYQKEHIEAEAKRDAARAATLEVFLRAQNTGRFDDYLDGRGHLYLHTSPRNARVEVLRYVQKDRFLTPALRHELGHTPLVAREMAMGSYLLVVSAPDHAPLHYPVRIDRQQTWTGRTPDSQAPVVLRLPADGELLAEEVLVAAGPFLRGGDDQAPGSLPRAVRWVDGFVIQRHPVTHAEYLAFLNDLVEQGREAEAEKHCPKRTDDVGFGQSHDIYARRADGRFASAVEEHCLERVPVTLINWFDALAYARWYSQRTGLEWRLPTEDEWEKAARGVDGRFFPWGDFLDPTWCRMLNSSRNVPHPVPVDSYPEDVSPFGLCGAAGNVRDWCVPNKWRDVDLTTISPQESVPFRGGSWFSTAPMCRLSSRELKPARSRSAGTGFRLVRDYR